MIKFWLIALAAVMSLVALRYEPAPICRLGDRPGPAIGAVIKIGGCS
ncbi:hypothetical protein [Bradyrhizobium sp. HKCCYLR20261]